jgi:hypothetical protein
MARPPTGSEALERARKGLAEAKTVDELRAAQAVVLPLIYGLSLEETAQIVGRSAGWVARQRRRYIKGELDFVTPSKRGGRRHQLLGEEEEFALVKRGIMLSAYAWSSTPRQKIRELIDARLSEPVADSTLDSIILRVARKTIPGGTASDLMQLSKPLTEKWLRERVLVQKKMGKKLAV